VDYKLELVLIPVGDVDRAKAFYIDTLQWRLNVDHSPNESFRIVQVDPPGSACSVGFGIGIGVTATPGSMRGLHLMVADIVAAREELVAKGVDAKEIRHVGMDGVWHDGPHPDRSDYNSFSEFADPDGNVWLLQERGYEE
jgi:catechol 2,3-dioxygenase-like lactoylglutathione lyase family enzyme